MEEAAAAILTRDVATMSVRCPATVAVAVLVMAAAAAEAAEAGAAALTAT